MSLTLYNCLTSLIHHGLILSLKESNWSVWTDLHFRKRKRERKKRAQIGNDSGLPSDTVCASWTHWNQNLSPSSLFCVWSWPSKLATWGCVYSLKLRTKGQQEKGGCGLGSGAMLSAQFFCNQSLQALWSSCFEKYSIKLVSWKETEDEAGVFYKLSQ